MLAALLVPACAAPASQPPRLPLEVTILAFCRMVAAQMAMEVKLDPARVKFLRIQVGALLPVARRGLPSDNSALPLLQAAQGALEVLAGEDAVGERRYGRAARRLGLHWRELRKSLAADSPLLTSETENLALLWELGGLRGIVWREEGLRHRLRRAKEPKEVLEKDLATIVEERYGPWLTVAELEPMLEFCGYLANLWLQEGDNTLLTERIAALALKDDADRVWRLAARKGNPSLQEDLGRLLDRVDANLLAKAHGKAALKLGEALLGTPQDAAARRLLKRMDAAATERVELRALRRAIARLVGDWETEADLLCASLSGATSVEEKRARLGEAAEILRLHSHGELLKEATRLLLAEAPIRPNTEGGDWNFSEALLVFADLQRDAGHPEEAEALIRLCLAVEDPLGRKPEARYRLLASLGRFAELEAALGDPDPQEGLEVLGWRFRCALVKGRNEPIRAAALAWLEATLRMDLEANAPRLPGLSLARPVLGDATDRLAALANRFGARWLPGQEALLKREPAWMLVALDTEAQDRPPSLEDSLRWRLGRVPPGAPGLEASESLRKETEARLGSGHPLVVEVLLKQSEGQSNPDPKRLEEAREILTATGDPKGLRFSVCATLAGLYSQEGNGVGLEREGLLMLELLESQEAPDFEKVEGLAQVMTLQLWREQRLEELPALFIRLDRLAARLPRGEEIRNRLQEGRQFLHRAGRCLAQLRAAGLG